MPEVKQWQAVALALNIDPNTLGRDPHPISGNPYTWDDYPSRNLLSPESNQKFKDLAQLLHANRFFGNHFMKNGKADVLLDEFAAWCVEIDQDIPEELRALAKPTAQTIPAAPEEPLHSTTPPTDVKISEQDEELAGLFDPVTVEALEKMFPANGKWKVWANGAKQNGLIKARKERAKYNPYDAAIWFLSKGITGWDLARCYRVLANNLPPRSRNKAHMLTDFLD